MAIYRMTVRWAFPIGSLGGTNTWHIRSTSAPVGGTAPSTTNLIKTFYTSIANLLCSTTTVSWDGTLSEVGTTDPAVVAAGTGWTVTGSGGPTYGPAGVGVVVGWRSGTASKSGRGRTFLAPLVSAVLVGDGTPVDGNLAGIRTAANALVSGSLADGNGAISIWSPTQNIGRDVQSAKVNDRVAFLSTRRS